MDQSICKLRGRVSGRSGRANGSIHLQAKWTGEQANCLRGASLEIVPRTFQNSPEQTMSPTSALRVGHNHNPDAWDLVDNDPDGPPGWVGTPVHWMNSYKRIVYAQLVLNPYNNYDPPGRLYAMRKSQRTGNAIFDRFWTRELRLGGRACASGRASRSGLPVCMTCAPGRRPVPCHL